MVFVVFYRLILCVCCLVGKVLMISFSEVGIRIVVLMFCSIWNVISFLMFLVIVYSLDVMVNNVIFKMNICLCFIRLVSLLVVIRNVVKIML